MATVVLVSAVTGLISGVIASLVAPWVQWAIEKRRNRMSYRRELIASWRHELDTMPLMMFRKPSSTALYGMMKPHLRPQARADLEAEVVVETAEQGNDVSYRRARILRDEITRLENKWGLV